MQNRKIMDQITNEQMSPVEPAGGDSAVVQNLRRIQARIAEAAGRVDRDPSTITLVAVSKTKPFAMIQSALDAGQLDFGENRFEDAWSKVEQSRELGLTDIRWHFIGSIQSRKTDQAVGPFALVHSVDRMKIATRLNRDAEAAGCQVPVLLQANVSGEASKHGFTPKELLQLAPQLSALSNLRIEGLMTMAPFVDHAEETRPVFRALRQLRDEMVTAHPSLMLPHLSMGMTNDFEVAIEEGATIVRIGSAIFGERD